MLRSSAFMLGGALVGWLLASFPADVDQDKSLARPLPTPRKAIVLTALDQRSEIDVQECPLQDVIQYLSEIHRVQIQFDRTALDDAGINGDTRVTGTLRGVTLRSLLKLLLGDLKLTYVLGDGYLLITTESEAENKLHVRVYPVDDLVTGESEFRSPLDPSGQTGADFKNLDDVITSVIAPDTWQDVGGPGTLTHHANTRTLAVSQTDVVHEQIAALLVNLRRVRDKQLAAADSASRFDRNLPRDAENSQRELEIRVYRFYPTTIQAAAGKNAPPAADDAAANALAGARLDAWTKALAGLAQQVIAPASWEPTGEGRIRAMSGTVVVRQTADVQAQVAKLIFEMLLPGLQAAWYPRAPIYGCSPPVRLSMPPGKIRWPHEAEPPPCDAEAHILAALEEECDLDFADQPLSDAIAALAQRHHIQLHIDRRNLSRAGVADSTPITSAIRGITVRTALTLTLDELDLAYVLGNEALLVTTKTEAENALVNKVYPVFDLVVRRPDAPSRAPALDFSSLINNITTTLAPHSWQDVGGPGTIESFTNAGALVISQTTDTHEQIAAFLQALREAAVAAK